MRSIIARNRIDLLASGTAAIYLLIRIGSLGRSPLSGDEALHFHLVNMRGFAAVYRSSLTSAHPPLFFQLLHLWSLLNSSEFFLRLLPAVLGGAFLWASYRWAESLFGKGASFLTLVLLALSPALWSLSGEVRAYTLLLFLMALALALLENALRARSAGRMALFSCALYLAILTHFAAFWFFLAVLAYTLVRFRKDPPPVRVIGVWGGFQLGALLLYAVLYVTHVAALRGSSMETRAMTQWLGEEYFHPVQQSLAGFLSRQTLSLFRFLFGSTAAAVLSLVATGGVVIWLAVKRRPAAVLFALPFLFGAGAGAAGLFPYGGTRHSISLLLFASGAIGALGGAITAGRLWPVTLGGTVLVTAVCLTFALPQGSDLPRMIAAMDRLRSAVPAGSPLFTDCQSGLLLSYYLGPRQPRQRETGPPCSSERSAGAYRISPSGSWSFDKDQFDVALKRFANLHGIGGGQRMWLVQIGPGFDPLPEISRRYPAATFPFVSRSGEISIIEAALP